MQPHLQHQQQQQQQQQHQQQQQQQMYDDFEPDHLSPTRREGPAFTSPQPAAMDPYGVAYPTTNYYGQQPYQMQVGGYNMPPQPQMQQPYQPYPMQPGKVKIKI